MYLDAALKSVGICLTPPAGPQTDFFHLWFFVYSPDKKPYIKYAEQVTFKGEEQVSFPDFPGISPTQPS